MYNKLDYTKGEWHVQQSYSVTPTPNHETGLKTIQVENVNWKNDYTSVTGNTVSSSTYKDVSDIVTMHSTHQRTLQTKKLQNVYSRWNNNNNYPMLVTPNQLRNKAGLQGYVASDILIPVTGTVSGEYGDLVAHGHVVLQVSNHPAINADVIRLLLKDLIGGLTACDETGEEFSVVINAILGDLDPLR